MDAPALAMAAGAAFATGLLGGLHCAGMCGGIVAALSAPSVAPAHSAALVPKVATAVRVNFVPARSGPGSRRWPIALAFNGGRIATYALAGSVAGAAGSMLLFVDGTLPVQRMMYAAANLMLAALGLYLLGVTRFLRGFERAGAGLWRRLQPLLRHLLPANTLPRAAGLGVLWGWMPCGLVYSVLAIALLTGSAWQGALVLAAFGAGTLPNLLLVDALLRWSTDRRALNVVRGISGALLVAFGLAGLAHGSGAGAFIAHAESVFCLTAH